MARLKRTSTPRLIILGRGVRAGSLRIERKINKVGAGNARLGMGPVTSRNMLVRKLVAFSWGRAGWGDFEQKHPRGYRGRFRSK